MNNRLLGLALGTLAIAACAGRDPQPTAPAPAGPPAALMFGGAGPPAPIEGSVDPATPEPDAVTPEPAATAPLEAEATASPTASPSPEDEGSPTPDPDESSTPRPSTRPSKSPSPSPKPSKTPSPSPSPSASASASPSASPSGGASASPTPAPSGSASASAAPSASPSPTPVPTPTPTPTPAPVVKEVAVRDFQFAPAVVRVAAGTVVRWRFEGPMAHTSTSAAGSSEAWDSGLKGAGTTFDHRFDTVGTYNYVCTPHASMVGRVIVE